MGYNTPRFTFMGKDLTMREIIFLFAIFSLFVGGYMVWYSDTPIYLFKMPIPTATPYYVEPKTTEEKVHIRSGQSTALFFDYNRELINVLKESKKKK